MFVNEKWSDYRQLYIRFLVYNWLPYWMTTLLRQIFPCVKDGMSLQKHIQEVQSQCLHKLGKVLSHLLPHCET